MPRERPGRPRVRLHAALLAIQVMFGSLSVAGKLALASLPPSAIVAVRAAAGALLLQLLPGRERIARGDLARVALCGLLGITSNQLFFLSGLERSTAVNAVVIGTVTPVLTVALALAAGREAPRPRTIVGLAIAFASTLALVGAGRFEGGRARLVGNLMVVCGSLSYALYMVVSQPLLERYRPMTVVRAAFAFGALAALLIGGAPLAAHAPALDRAALGVLGYIVLVPTVGAYALNAWALQQGGASLVSVYLYLQPVVAAILAAAILRERPGLPQALCAAGIALGIAIVSSRRRGSQVRR